jgi:hypothetical protein
MKVILFGASGMIGQGVLRECLLDPGVERVLAVARAPLPQQNDKLRVLVHPDFTRYDGVDLAGYDACFWCLGVTSVGTTEEAYHRITHDFAVALPFKAVYVFGPGPCNRCTGSGAGQSSTTPSTWLRRRSSRCGRWSRLDPSSRRSRWGAP